MKLKLFRWLLPSVAVLPLVVLIRSAQANCNDRIASLELVQPVMERLWQQLTTQTNYAWGAERPYGELVRDRIQLTPSFDRMTGPQKTQVLDRLHLDYNENWFKPSSTCVCLTKIEI